MIAASSPLHATFASARSPSPPYAYARRRQLYALTPVVSLPPPPARPSRTPPASTPSPRCWPPPPRSCSLRHGPFSLLALNPPQLRSILPRRSWHPRPGRWPPRPLSMLLRHGPTALLALKP